ncbi:hypothetical protein [Promicromonospora sp. NPDC057488]|uniref:hypothetical protein n=1 Tax=Promicromonospora sp. NPDC057488 TaxID=3346147 RepID=UPI00366E3B7D
MRTVGEDPLWITNGSFWTGNLDANTIAGVPKPTVLAWIEDRTSDRWFRTEVMTLVTDQITSSDPAPSVAPDVSPDWLARLQTSLDVLATVPTERVAYTQDAVKRRLHRHFGDRVDATVERWVTAHNDLHWADLTAPDLAILDWEGWGIAPAGYDAATLYCHSLLIPETARQVHEQFADVLDTTDGQRSQLFAIARILDRARHGDYKALAERAKNHLRTLLGDQS